MRIPSPWIHDIGGGEFVVRTDSEGMWLKTTDFYDAVHMCTLIKNFQQKFEAAVKAVARMEEQVTGHILLTEEV